MTLRVRALDPDEMKQLTEPARSRKLGAGLVRRAQIVLDAVDNLNIHCALDVLLFSLAHPRREFAFQPKDAADLNLIGPWWKVLHSSARPV